MLLVCGGSKLASSTEPRTPTGPNKTGQTHYDELNPEHSGIELIGLKKLNLELKKSVGISFISSISVLFWFVAERDKHHGVSVVMRLACQTKTPDHSQNGQGWFASVCRKALLRASA